MARSFFRGTSGSYDRVAAWATFGLDRRWKRRLLAHVPVGAGRVLDLACGTGLLTGAILDRCPTAEVVGVDLTAEYLDRARRRFAGVPRRVEWILGDAQEVALPGRFDAVVSSYLPKYVVADRLVANLDGHLAPGGVLAVHDFTLPLAGPPRAVWTLHMRLLATAWRRAFPEWSAAFDHRLEDWIRRTPWTRAFTRALRGAGYRDVTTESLTWRSASIVSAHRPGP